MHPKVNSLSSTESVRPEAGYTLLFLEMLHFLGLISPSESTSVTLQGSVSTPPISPGEEEGCYLTGEFWRNNQAYNSAPGPLCPDSKANACILAALSSLREGCSSPGCAVTEGKSV